MRGGSDGFGACEPSSRPASADRVERNDEIVGKNPSRRPRNEPRNRYINRTLHLHARAEWGRKGNRRQNRKTRFCPRIPHLASGCIPVRKWPKSVNTLDRDRTCNLQLRRLTLYPIELRGRGQKLTSPDHPAVAAPPRLFSAWEPAACHRRARPRGRDFVRRAHRLAMPWEDDVSPHLRPNHWRSPEASPPALDPRAPPGLTPTFAAARNPAADVSGPKGPRAPRRSGSSFPGRSLRCPPPPPPCPSPDSRSTAGDARRG